MAAPDNWHKTTIGNGNDPTRDTSIDVPGGDGVPPVPADDSLVGDNGERYQIDAILGQGGGGIVWQATDRHTGRVVALKATTRTDSEAGRRRQERLIAEARVTARLDHPNIPPIYDLARAADGRCYFTMRLVRGRSLLDLIDDAVAGRPADLIATPGDAIDLMRKVCDAVAFAHHHGIVHRDLKPANILVGDFGEVVVADWGTATTIAEAASEHRLIGTPLYLAPEQARCEGATPASDVYALGATLLHVLARTSPVPTDGDAEAFWERKREGMIADDALDSLPTALAAVVRNALALAPENRPADAEALGVLLATWQRHRESIHLAERASEAIAILERRGEYLGFRRCQDDCAQALTLWPGYAHAIELQQRIRAAHATFALDQGDLALAEELITALGEGHEALQARCQALRASQRNQRRRARNQRLLLASAIILALCAGVAWGLDRLRATSAWRPVATLDLRQPGDVAKLILSSKNDVRFGEPPPITEGGVLLDSERLLWVDGVNERGDVRLEAEITFPGEVDGFELLVHAERENPPIPWHPPRAYQSQVGGYQGRFALLAVIPVAGQYSVIVKEPNPLESQRRYRVRLQMLGNRLSLWLDDRMLLDHESYLPLVGAKYGALAMRCWAPVIIHSVRIERRSLPELASPLIAGDALLASGATAEAVAAYLAVAEDHRNRPIAETATGRAVLAACRDDDLHLERDRIFGNLERRSTNAGLLQACRAAIALQDWRHDRFEDAITRAERVIDENPNHRLIQDMLAHKVQDLSPVLANQLLQLLSRSSGIIELNLNDLPISDLAPISGMRDLERIDLRGTQVTDLSPLAGLHLAYLNIEDLAVTSLEPLAGMPIKGITLSRTQVTSLEPLRGAPLVSIYCNATPISDLEPIAAAPLERVEASESAITSLPHFSSSPIVVSIRKTAVKSLEGLPVTRLKELVVENCPIADLEALREARFIWRLDISGTRVQDLSPVAACPLTELAINACDITTISGLSLDKLRRLSCYDTPVSDLTPLRGSPLESITASGSRIADLSPLTGAPLTTLNLDRCLITDLSPLKGMRLDTLTLSGCPLADFEQLAALSVTNRLNIMNTPLIHRAVELAERWSLQRNVPKITMQLRAQSHMANGKPLREVSAVSSGRRFLVLPIDRTLSDARRIAAEQGAHLFRPDHPDWVEDFRSNWCGSMTVWTDLQRKNGAWCWSNGAPVDATRLAQNFRLHPQDYAGGFFFLPDRAIDSYAPQPDHLASVVLEWDD